ncbi:hypothetical protein Clacol_000254 [Clathrus columnatus]|uniref:Uncharacterized protein n=1 Tax=Clathrus columnatus TaxID=1419009 RepID=A0AAV5A0G3_9AGAM|nr:hypothetical protein Clacol_000254 [Clathrus columnatus]
MEAATTTTTTQFTADLVVPTIHLGSFKSYQLPFDRPQTNNNGGNADYSPNVYLQQRHFNNINNTPSRSASAPYPINMPTSSHKPYIAKQPSLGNPTAMAAISNLNSSNAVTPSPRMLPSPAVQASPIPVPVQPSNYPPQTLGPPRELCLECMMRDEDMADVDVTSPGVWERESDVWYLELCRREEEEERERNLHPSTSSGISSSASCSRPRARGTKLTEGNLVVWLNLPTPLTLAPANRQNPPEPAAKQQTLFAYLDAQNAILAAENKARIQALQEAHHLDKKMRESYLELHRSPYDFTSPDNASIGNSSKAQSPSIREIHDTKNGTLRRETSPAEIAAMDSRSQKTRKVSRDNLAQVDAKVERETAHFYGLNGTEGGSPDHPVRSQILYGSTTSVPMLSSTTSVIRNVQSMYMPDTSSNWQQPSTSIRPASMTPDILPGFSSQTSLTSASPSPKRRFFGLRQWSGYFGSNVSLAQSGSMMDMHLGLEQDRHGVYIPPVDIGSKPPSLQEATPWPGMDGRHSLDNGTIGSDSAKKRRGLSRLWKMLSGGSAKSNEPALQSHRHDLDEEPLAPPPPLSYLVNRGSMQSERSIVTGGRHASMPSLSFSNTGHPASTSTPQPSKTASARSQMVGLSSPSEQSSTLPSPTEIRFPHRDCSPERSGVGAVTIGDEELSDSKRRMTSNSTRCRSLSQNSLATPIPLPASSFKSTISSPSPLGPVPIGNTTITGSPKSISTSSPTSHVMTRSFSVDKNLPPLPPDEQPDSSVVPSSVSTTTPVTSLPTISGLKPPLSETTTPFLTTFPIASQQQPFQAHQQPYLLEYPSSGFRAEEPIRRQSFNGPIPRPNLPVGAGRASIPGLRQYAYDEFGNAVVSTRSRHSLAVGPVGVQSLPNGTKRKTKLGIGSIFGKRQ